jgi:predicted NUDIX family phosphoesterase
MLKSDEQVLCVPASRLGECGVNPGFTRTSGDVVLRALLARGVFLPRGDVEENPKYRQIVTYDLIVSTAEGPERPLVFTYHRRGDEGRLRQHSCGVGGHLTAEDFRTARAEGGPTVAAFNRARWRELSEEIYIDAMPTMMHRLEGFIAIDANPVDRVHLGVVHRVVVPGIVRGNSAETEESRLVPADQLRQPAMFERFEPWSKIIIYMLVNT